VEEALAVAAQVKPSQAWFTHLSHDLMHEELELTLPENVRIAFDGLKLEL
jgi:phosphoribosyl 1,2-cyclic phosphate phosphodiesterase